MSLLRTPRGARRYNDRVTLALAEATRDRFGHAAFADPVPVLEVWAEVRYMSAARVLDTFQQADVVGVEIEFRAPTFATWNRILWRGHLIIPNEPQDVGNRGRILRVTGYYPKDNPVQLPPPTVTPDNNG